MGHNKLEIAEKAKDNRLMAVMTTVLVALLLISQLSLASENAKPRYILDDNYGSLKVNDTDGNENDINIFPPDFLHITSEQEQQAAPLWPDYDSSVVHVENQSFPYPIRAPPQIS